VIEGVLPVFNTAATGLIRPRPRAARAPAGAFNRPATQSIIY
jgi:hypothetical protein